MRDDRAQSGAGRVPSHGPPVADGGQGAEDVVIEPELGRGPGVLVIHSGRGLTPYVETICSSLANRGFVAMAVDLFEGTTPTTAEEAVDVKEAVDERGTQLVLERSVRFLQDYETVSRPAIGVVGLGYGAGWACSLTHAKPAAVGALVLFYGYRDGDWTDVTAPVIGHFAELDRGLPPSRVDELRESLAADGVDVDFFVYQGADAAFFERDAGTYDPEAADLAWERTVSFLDGTLHER